MAKIHHLADVQSKNIGNDTAIWQFCVVLDGAVIGSNCNINCNVLIEGKAIIGDNVTIKPGVQIWDGVILEDNVFIGPNVTFTNDLVPRSKQYPETYAGTIIRKGASIGANSTIIAGNTVGEYALVGAGSVLTKSILPFTVYYGNPALHKGYITKEGLLLNLDLKDNDGNEYAYKNDDLVLKTI